LKHLATQVTLCAFFFLALLIAVPLALSPKAEGEDFSLPLYDEDDQYFAILLRAALEAADGDHRLSTSKIPVAQSRVLRSLLDHREGINVLYTGHSTERENLMRQIDIPLSRGLLGYRVFVIRPQSQHLFQGIETLEGLTQRITVGSGTSWPDTTILRAAGFNVKTGSVENLWQMLARNRFIAFPRGMNEVHAELKRYAETKLKEAVATENTVMIYYPYDHFFYVAPEDETRANIIEQGLKRIYENGEFMRIFNSDPAISKSLALAAKYRRKVISLPNPLNSDRINKIPAKYWHSFEAP